MNYVLNKYSLYIAPIVKIQYVIYIIILYYYANIVFVNFSSSQKIITTDESVNKAHLYADKNSYTDNDKILSHCTANCDSFMKLLPFYRLPMLYNQSFVRHSNVYQYIIIIFMANLH